jgi:hypothetical protein
MFLGLRRAMSIRPAQLAWLAAACLLAAPLAQAVPTTFTNVVGNAILCRSQLDSAYFYQYLNEAFGPPYKHEGGAWWFKADAKLWGMSVLDVIVSDDSSALTFIGAVTELAPAEVGDAVRAQVGVVHTKVDKSAFSALTASPGSTIVFFKNRSKIYCAKFKQLPPHLQGS